MAFDFTTPFPQTDPDLVPRFTRTFEHLDWIDGESIVQAERTPTEEGFNTRFRKIIADLDALSDDSRRALLRAAAMRSSLFAILGEVEAALTALGTPDEDWRTPALENGWTGKNLDESFEYNPPGFFRDRAGVVHLRGNVGDGPNPGNTQSVIFHLPVGYRPPRRTVLPVMTPIINSPGVHNLLRLDVVEDGAVALRGPYFLYVNLDGVSFRAR